MNPVLLTIIREAYYTSKTSIARQTYLLYLKYPSLKRDMKYMGFNWASALPKNAFVMGAVAVSPSSQVAVQCWPVLTTMYLGQTGTQGVGGGTFLYAYLGVICPLSICSDRECNCHQGGQSCILSKIEPRGWTKVCRYAHIIFTSNS